MSAPMSDQSGSPRWALWLPLGMFLAFVLLAVVVMMWPGDRNVASGLVGQPLPAFTLKAAMDDRPGLSSADMTGGKPRLLNVFASWCVPCAAEAPVLAQLQKAGVPIDGIAIRDRKEDVAAFLARNGNPFARIGADDVGAVQIALGSSGVPETFVIDGKGVIRYQHIGDIRPEQMPMIMAKLKEAGR